MAEKKKTNNISHHYYHFLQLFCKKSFFAYIYIFMEIAFYEIFIVG